MRTTTTKQTTKVWTVCRPLAPKRESGVHLSDLREFLKQAYELPDDLLVSFEESSLNESGRYNVTISVTHEVEVEPRPKVARGAGAE